MLQFIQNSPSIKRQTVCEVPAYTVVEQIEISVGELSGDELLTLFLTGDFPEGAEMKKVYHPTAVSY